MKVIKFSLTDEEEAVLVSLTTNDACYGMTPRLLFLRLIKQELARVQPAAQREPEKKQTAAERNQEVLTAQREAVKAADLVRFRATGIWPRYDAGLSAEHGKDFFEYPAGADGLGKRTMWTPPSDYPYFAEMESARDTARMIAEMSGAPVKRLDTKAFTDAEGNIDVDALEVEELRLLHIEAAKYA